MTVEEKNLYNRVTFIINDDWSKCIDEFGLARTKAYAVSYRDNSRILVNQNVTFWEWCAENASNDPTYTTENILEKEKSVNKEIYLKGTKIRITEERKDLGLSVGTICEVCYIDCFGILHVNYNGKSYALMEGIDRFEKVSASKLYMRNGKEKE